MRTTEWEQLLATGSGVPSGARLDDLTTELVTMLADPDPHVRDDVALSLLTAWVHEGVYDELLAGLGDGLAAGLRAGIGRDGDQTVLRRSYSAVGLACVVARDTTITVLPAERLLTWADRAMGWFTAERDLRDWDRTLGLIGAVSHGADLLGTLGASPHLGGDELAVLLDVLADRLTRPTTYVLGAVDLDRLAYATMSLLHRDLVSIDTLERWVRRVAAPSAVGLVARDDVTYAPSANSAGYLRALQLQLLLGVHATPTQDQSSTPHRAPVVRGDLLIAVQHELRLSAPWLYHQPR